MASDSTQIKSMFFVPLNPFDQKTSQNAQHDRNILMSALQPRHVKQTRVTNLA